MSDVLERLSPLFRPRGIVLAGVSSHPGKFGAVAFHNLLRFGFAGPIFPIKPDGAEVFGRPTLSEVSQVPDGAADLAFLCTPAKLNAGLLRACAAKGVRAAYVASGGYAEAGEDGRELERELVETAEELGVALAGPNGQGIVSTPVSMCAQIVAPYPPPGPLSMVSQSGNVGSSFMNYGCLTGVGYSKGISCGNAAQLEVAEFIEYYAEDPDTLATLVYLEGLEDGRRFAEVARAHALRKPLVVLRGGATRQGQRAASSHTGALASDDAVFDGVCRLAGAVRAASVEEAYEAAAAFATQPLPRGPRTLIVTAAGGWGVLTADACVRAGLELIELPDDLRRRIDGMVPSRWSGGNPIDLAGGETRDTIPEVLDLAAAHPEVDAVIYLGIGIQAAQANQFRSGPYYPDHGLDRIVDFHERQDGRYAQAASEASELHGKPVLVATDLALTDRDYGNSGPLGVQRSGRIVWPSGHRAVRTLSQMLRYSRWLSHRST
ncbi:MAG: CoA-binding protein [Proteobacteria bacterium]|nr:CoA-binding protein [Pseudomonadota bacterium]